MFHLQQRFILYIYMDKDWGEYCIARTGLDWVSGIDTALFHFYTKE